MKIKKLVALIGLACPSSLLAMDMDNPDVKNHHVSWVPQSRATGEIMEEVLVFRSRSTGTIYQVNMRYNWPLKEYIRHLKKESRLSKNEGLYNYNSQYFFIQGKFYSGDTLLSYQNVCKIIEDKQVIEFKFKPI